MNRRTPRTWRGRVLPRAHEDVEDQGLAFDVGTLMGRRSLLRAAGIGVVGLGLAGCSDDSDSTRADSGSTAEGELPDETAGPYPGDGSNGPDVLEESGIIRSDIRASFGDADGVAEGVPMTLQLNLSDMANGGSAFAGVAVYVWHCDRNGDYSMYSSAIEKENYLRGVQVADDDGIVRFTSIFPACYTGRWPHIHFEVYPDADAIDDSTNAIATSQVALPQDACAKVYATDGYEASLKTFAEVSLDSDNVFGDDGGVLQLASVTGDVERGFAVQLAVREDTRTEPTGGRPPSGGPGGTPPQGGPGGTPPQGGPNGTPPQGGPNGTPPQGGPNGTPPATPDED
ncbi:intradiol ring-cleavage dioxygenase [Nocardioides yefusunii]|uniref:Intradiol ring-cleavage dioxygenase n=1 Tax=Nocardioides yefusunii TaxID=2500546 RepID=A0ABW1QW05_9ACTN|nr:intradiol ring-cleavage dioxygenase [Nocardioides yefusunii]